MPATKRLVLDLPADQVDLIERRVARGEYESASALVADQLESESAPPVLDVQTQAASDLRVTEAMARIDAGLERTYPAEQVFAELRAELEERLREEERRADRA